MSLFAGRVYLVYFSGFTGFTGVSAELYLSRLNIRSKYEHKYRDN